MRTYTLIFTEHDAGGMDVSATNCGFNGLELVTLLELKKQDILEQVRNPIKFNRVIHRDNGEVAEITDN
jgi:hypothetical protein